MSKKPFFDRVMARIGYVPGPAKYADSICSLKIDVDSASVDLALAKVIELSTAAAVADAELKRACESATATAQLLAKVQAITSEIDLHDLIHEIRADRQERAQAMQQQARARARARNDCGCGASGLPG